MSTSVNHDQIISPYATKVNHKDINGLGLSG